MTKEDKVKAIHFLNSNGAMLITKSGDKIAKHFGISFAYKPICSKHRNRILNF